MPDPILIAPYDPQWPRRFSQLAADLRTALGETARRIDHIGSTAVPGLDAKPVIDVQIAVASLEPLEAYRLPLEALGYVHRADNPDLSKRYFREAPGRSRTHIHVRPCGSWAEQFALLFRDYLRAHPADAQRYAALKYSLAEKHRNDRRAYTEAKEPFIWEIMQKADQWSQDTGRQPGPSDG